jgi:serine/threonine protein phosphatase PrpC
MHRCRPVALLSLLSVPASAYCLLAAQSRHRSIATAPLWSATLIRGRPPQMEDTFSLVRSLNKNDNKNENEHGATESDSPIHNNVTYAAVFDGHCGSACAQAAAQTLHLQLAANPSFVKGEFEGALREVIPAWDRHWLNEARRLGGRDDGTTAVLALVQETTITVAHVGDSRAILVDLHSGMAQSLTKDHKVTDPVEKKRTLARGGLISWGYVVNPKTGNGLAMTRALGDASFKMAGKISDADAAGLVINVPDVSTVTLPSDGRDRLLVLATDGLWDVLEAEDVALLCQQAMMECDRTTISTDEGNGNGKAAPKPRSLKLPFTPQYAGLGDVIDGKEQLMPVRSDQYEVTESISDRDRENQVAVLHAMSRKCVEEAWRRGTYDNVTVLCVLV